MFDTHLWTRQALLGCGIKIKIPERWGYSVARWAINEPVDGILYHPLRTVHHRLHQVISVAPQAWGAALAVIRVGVENILEALMALLALHHLWRRDFVEAAL